MKQTIEQGGGGWRFGLPTEKLICYRQLISVARIARERAKGLERSGKRTSADPNNWWGSIEPVKVSDCIIERWTGDVWVPHSKA